MQLSRRSLLAVVLVLLVIILGFWAWSGRASAPATIETGIEYVPEATTIQDATREASQQSPSIIVRATDTSVARTSAEVRGTATLVVDDARYALTAPEGTTLKDAMDMLVTENSFTYSFRDYAGLGAFVTGINGRAGTDDYVWILYVNGKKSAAGISSTHIRSSDLIEWKLEKSY